MKKSFICNLQYRGSNFKGVTSKIREQSISTHTITRLHDKIKILGQIINPSKVGTTNIMESQEEINTALTKKLGAGYIRLMLVA
jgi:hypothetical protein